MNHSDDNQELIPAYPTAAILDGVKLLFLGLVFALFAAAILWVNEWNHLITLKSQEQNANAAVGVSPGEPVDSANEGRLLFMMGEIETTGPLEDDWLGLKVEGARLYRRVQVFKAGEKSKQEPLIMHAGEWVDQASAEVPAIGKSVQARTITSHMWNNNSVKVGNYSLGTTLIDRLTRFRPVPITPYLKNKPWANKLAQPTTSTDESNGPQWQKSLYGLLWSEPNRPYRTGDIRIHYYHVPDGAYVSLVARQGEQGRLEPFLTRHGEVIERLQFGRVYQSEMYPEGDVGFNWLVWCIRIVGSLLMWAGCWFLILPGTRLIQLLDIRNLRIDFEPIRMSALAAFLLSLLVMSAAWVYYQPVWGTVFILVVLAVLGIAGYSYWRKLRVPRQIEQQKTLRDN